MSSPILYVTGTNTGVGKTTLAVLLLRSARDKNVPLAALKPFCSGGREDAERLHAAQTSSLTLDEVNPFHFVEPLAPLVAARQGGRAIVVEDVLIAIDRAKETNLPILIEGAGGLLSPLGEGFSLHEIIQRAPGKVIIVAPNALGTLNSILLTVARLALPSTRQAIVLMSPEHPDLSSETNHEALTWLLPGTKIHELPYFGQSGEPNSNHLSAINPLLQWWLGS